MMRRTIVCLAVLLAGAFVSVAGAAEPDAATAAADAERQQLQLRRTEVEARYEGRVRDCEQRILVTDCLNRARKERRESLTPIDDRLATLDEADRARRAAERRARIDEKQAKRAAAEQAEAAAHRAEVERRNNADTGKPAAAPLPPASRP